MLQQENLLSQLFQKKTLLIIFILNSFFISQNVFADASRKSIELKTTSVIKNNPTTKLNFESIYIPDIRGKFELKNKEEQVIAAFKITGSERKVFIEIDTNSETELTDYEDERFDEIINGISGVFIWDDQESAFRRLYTFSTGTRRYIEIHGGNPTFLGVRRNGGDVSGSSYWFSLYKVQGSLSDLANTSKNDVSAYGGTWYIEGNSNQIHLSSGVDYDMLVRYGDIVYELSKLEGSVIESYQGVTRETNEELTIKVVSGTKIKIDLGDTHIIATRSSGSMSKTVSSNSASSSSSGSASTNPMNDKLFKAISQDDQTQVEEVLELGASINATNAQGRTPLETAVQKSEDDTSIVQSLIDNQAKVSNYALEQAINKDNDELIDLLINNGGDKNFVATKAIEKSKAVLFQTMLDTHNVSITNRMFDQALNSRKYPLADIMISKGFNPNYALEACVRKDASDLVYAALEAGGSGNTALKYAVQKNDIELATLAIDNHSARANPFLKDAISKNNIPMVTLLLDKGANPNTEIPALATAGKNKLLKLLISKEGNANLGIEPAAKASKLITLKLLLDNGADANAIIPIAIEKNNTAMVKIGIEGGAKADAPAFIKSASTVENIEIIKLLLEAGANANPIIPIAIEKNNTIMVKMGIESGAKADAPEYIKTSSSKGNLEITTMLLEAGANPQDGMLSAVTANKPAIVKLLLAAEADGTSGDLLAKSTKHKSIELTGLLIEAGANPQDGITASVKNNAGTVLQQLIDAGGDANNQDLLTIAVVNNNLNTSKILIGLGLEANKSDAKGLTYLHHAAKNDNSGLTKLLLEKGAEVDAVAQGNTPLHLAVDNRRGVATVDLLIKAGANVNATNGKGKKVLKIAKGTKNKKLLKEHGAVKK